MPILVTAVLHYLQEVLGIDASRVKPWARANELPYFLRDVFQFSELELLGHPVVLAIGRGEAKQSLSDVRTWLDKVKALAGQPAVYVTDALASYERRRLIEQNVPFIVPGNQLYLPDLGLDLREYFRQRTPATEAALLYEESAGSLAKRQEEASRRREERDLGIPADNHPNKRERRLIHRFKRSET